MTIIGLSRPRPRYHKSQNEKTRAPSIRHPPIPGLSLLLDAIKSSQVVAKPAVVIYPIACSHVVSVAGNAHDAKASVGPVVAGCSGGNTPNGVSAGPGFLGYQQIGNIFIFIDIDRGLGCAIPEICSCDEDRDIAGARFHEDLSADRQPGVGWLGQAG